MQYFSQFRQYLRIIVEVYKFENINNIIRVNLDRKYFFIGQCLISMYDVAKNGLGAEHVVNGL